MSYAAWRRPCSSGDRLAAEAPAAGGRRGLDADAVADAMLNVPALDARGAYGSVDREKFGRVLALVGAGPTPEAWRQNQAPGPRHHVGADRSAQGPGCPSVCRSW